METEQLKPSEIVKELDRHIVGQDQAKRMIAIALRNRWRRRHVPEFIRDDIAPKNLIMMGPTGVGKTEIARRLSKLTDSPFHKVEASKFTEVGYVGRDVESMIRDLVELTVNHVRGREQERVAGKAERIAEERLLDRLLPATPNDSRREDPEPGLLLTSEGAENRTQDLSRTREKLRDLLHKGKLDDRYVDLDVADRNMPVIEIFSGTGMEEMGLNLQEMLGGMLPKNTKRRKVTVPEALELLKQEETQQLVEMETVVRTAIDKVEQSGIIFLDEIDKIIGKQGGSGPDVSREGVQRDLLPIVEGCSVNTKYGTVKTDHVLFIASGAFHAASPSDLIPELQGRFPIRVELDALGWREFERILKEPQNALVTQYIELLKTEGVNLTFEDDAIRELAVMAEEVNQTTENIGARRLHTMMEKLLEDVLFDAPDIPNANVCIDGQTVQRKLADIMENRDLSRYIL